MKIPTLKAELACSVDSLLWSYSIDNLGAVSGSSLASGDVPLTLMMR
jgi:hypothetical protein